MKEVLFRGFIKRDKGSKTLLINGEKVRGEWVYWNIYGELRTKSNKDTAPVKNTDGIRPEWLWYVHSLFPFLIPQTIGQFTGLTDKNGTNIFDGDILLKGFEKVVVKWNCNQCRWGIYSGGYEIAGFNEYTQGYFEVIGNIHSNPEMIKD